MNKRMLLAILRQKSIDGTYNMIDLASTLKDANDIRNQMKTAGLPGLPMNHMRNVKTGRFISHVADLTAARKIQQPQLRTITEMPAEFSKLTVLAK